MSGDSGGETVGMVESDLPSSSILSSEGSFESPAPIDSTDVDFVVVELMENGGEAQAMDVENTEVDMQTALPASIVAVNSDETNGTAMDVDDSETDVQHSSPVSNVIPACDEIDVVEVDRAMVLNDAPLGDTMTVDGVETEGVSQIDEIPVVTDGQSLVKDDQGMSTSTGGRTAVEQRSRDDLLQALTDPSFCYLSSDGEKTFLGFGDSGQTCTSLKLHFLSAKRGVPILNDGDINNCLVLLDIQLREEDVDTMEVTQLFKTLKSSDSEDEALRSVMALIAAIQPLDIRLVLELIEKAMKASEEIRDKDVILLLGPSRAGKSTTMHVLGGSRFEFDDSGGYDHYEPHPTDPQLNDIVARCSTRSVTRFIKAIRLVNPLNGNEVFACDTPGFEDTDGPEIDIANGLGIVSALKLAKSISPIIFFPDGQDRTSIALKKLIKILAELFGESAQVFSSFSYLFTHFESKKRRNQIHKRFQQTLEELSEEDKADTILVGWLNDICMKTRGGATIMIPDDEDAALDIWNLLNDISPIADPKSVVQHFLSSKSRDILRLEMAVLKESFSKALERRKWKSVFDKLSILTSLLFLSLNDIVIVYEGCMEAFTQTINDQLHELKGALNDVLISNEYFPRDLERVRHILLSFASLWSEANTNIWEESENCKFNVVHLLQELEVKLLKQVVATEKYLFLISDPNTLQILFKLRDFAAMKANIAENLEFGDKYAVLQEGIFQFLENSPNLMITYLNNSDYGTAIELYSVLLNPGEEYFQHLQKQVFDIAYNTSCTAIDDYFNHLAKSFSSLINKLGVDEFCSSAFELEVLKRINEIVRLTNSSLWKDEQNLIVQLMKGLERAVMDSLNVSVAILLEHLANLQANNDNIQYIVEVKCFVMNELKVQSTSFLANPLREVKFNLENMLRTLLQRAYQNIFEIFAQDIWNSDSLLNNLRILVAAKEKQLDGTVDGVSMYDMTVGDIKKRLSGLENTLKHIVQTMTLDNVHCVFDVYRNSVVLQCCEVHCPDLGTAVTAFKASFKECLIAFIHFLLHDNILQFCDLEMAKTERVPPRTIEKCKSMLDILHSIRLESNRDPELHWIVSNMDEVISNCHRQFESKANMIEMDVLTPFYNFISTFVGGTTMLSDITPIWTCFDNLFKYFLTWDSFIKYDWNPLQSVCNIMLQRYISEKGILALSINDLTNQINEADASASDETQSIVLTPKVDRLLLLANKLHEFATHHTLLCANDFHRIVERAQEWLKRANSSILSQIQRAFAQEQLDALLPILSQTKLGGMNDIYHETLKHVTQFLKTKIETMNDMISKWMKHSISNEKLEQLFKSLRTIDCGNNLLKTFGESLVVVNCDPINLLLEKAAKRFVKTSEKCLSEWEVTAAVESLMDLENMNKSITQETFNCWDTSKVVGVSSKALADANVKLCDTLDGIISKYSVFDKAYVESSLPDRLMRQLLAIKCDDTSRFSHMASTLVSVLSASITKALNETFSVSNPDLANCQQIVQQIEECKSFFPKDVLSNVQELLTTCYADIQKMKDEIDRNALQLQDMHRWEELKEAYFRALKFASFTYAKRLRGTIHVVMSREIEKYKKDMQDKAIVRCVEHIPYSWNAFMSYTRELDNFTFIPLMNEFLFKDKEAKDMCSGLRMQFTAMLLEYFAEIATFRNANVSREMLIALSDCCQVVRFANTWKTENPLFYERLTTKYSQPINLPNMLQDCVSTVCHCLMQMYNHIDEAFQSADYGKIVSIMDILARVDSKLNNIGEFIADANIKSRYSKDIKQLSAQFKTYTELKTYLANSLLQSKNIVEKHFVRNEKTSTPNSQDRMAFYEEYYQTCSRVKHFTNVSSHVDTSIFNYDTFSKWLADHVDGELKKFCAELEFCISKFPTTHQEYYREFNMFYDNLICFAEAFKDGKFDTIARSYTAKINRSMVSLFDKLRDDIIDVKTNVPIENLETTLMHMKELAVELFCYQKGFNDTIDGALHMIVKRNPGIIGKLAYRLSQSDNIVAKMLLEHKAFEEHQIIHRNKKTLTFTIKDVLGLTNANSKNILSGDAVNITRLDELYKEFDDCYWQLVDKGYWIDQDSARHQYLTQLVSDSYSKEKTSVLQQQLHVMAHVFAYWTLDKYYSKPQSTVSNEDGEEAAKGIVKEELLQPHAAQIIAIIRLLGVDTGSMENHLAQIKTGEGKSVTLAVTAIILATEGYMVDCACYSEYLSHRDYTSFVSLFGVFRVADKITYGTFNKICEKYLNRELDLRKEVERLITSSANSSMEDTVAHVRNNRSILLIDEVDVFLSKDFYGSMYRPLASVKHAKVSEVIQYMWDNKDTLDYKSFLQQPLYRECVDVFPTWKPLMEECLKNLIYDLKTFDSHQYVVVDGKIGYRDQDGISFTLNYGYKTMFAHYQEVEAGSLPKNVLDKVTHLQINCGVFAYAKIPNLYEYTLGVTGTLDTLTSKENEILSNIYNIKKHTYIPSMYGENQREFRKNHNDDIIIEREQSGYINAICNQINSRVVGSSGGKRAVLVFFQSKEKLDEFYNSPAAKGRRNEMTILTEETNTQRKEAIVQKAVTAGAITLLTRAFGRGTDFICYDDQIQKNDGVHVIQTFLSPLVSEETQIMGRTARQGNKGSFGMVLHATDLEQFGITTQVVDHIFNTGERYSTLAQYRDKAFESLFPDNMKFVNEIAEEHEKALKFVEDLVKASNLDMIRSTLVTFNTRIGMDMNALNGGMQRTLCLMDATGSMSDLLEKAKHTVQQMFERTYTILSENNVKDSFELQFAVYRNYSSGPSHIFSASPWATDPAEIRLFMSTIGPSGGQGNEAIEIGLNYALKTHTNEQPLTQVLLIGDMPPNMKEEVSAKRGSQSTWASTPYATPTYFKDEVERLKEEGIPVHAFYLKTNAKSDFEYIARETGGSVSSLDIHSPSGAAQLTDLVTKQILAGGKSAEVRNKLLSAYDAKYGFAGHVGGN